jgi:CCR4-NOT transcription complex subunit 1
VLPGIRCNGCLSVELLAGLLDGSSNMHIGEMDVAHILGIMAKIESSSAVQEVEQEVDMGHVHAEWNVLAFVDALKVVAPDLSWPAIILHLDHSSFGAINERGLHLIVQAFRLGCDQAFPVSALLREWKNTAGQLEIIRACLQSHSHVQEALLLGAGRGVCASANGTDKLYASVWSSGDFLRAMFMLAEKQGREEVEPLLRGGLKDHPESLLLGLAQCWPDETNLYMDILRGAFTRVAEKMGTSICSTALGEAWAISEPCFARCLQMLYEGDRGAEKLCAVLSLAITVDSLHEILSMHIDEEFMLDLAMYADNQKVLCFSQWLRKMFATDTDRFPRACADFLRGRVFAPCTVASCVPKVRPQHVEEIMWCLRNSTLSPSAQKSVQELESGAARPRLLGGAPPPVAGPGGQLPAGVGAPSADGAGKPGALPSGLPPQPGPPGDGTQMQVGQPQQPSALFAPDIEEEANSHFQRIYTSELEIDKVIQMLKGFKASNNQREQQIFACMIHNLFDEYRFFPRYPERELLITGKLFGSLIQHQLVSSITLGIALRYVLEALRKPFRTNMFKFGMCALEQFKSRLSEWPQYCHHINQIAHIRESHKDIIDFMPSGRPPAGQDGTAAQQGAVGLQQPALETGNRAASPATSVPAMPTQQSGTSLAQPVHLQQLMIQSLMKQQSDASGLPAPTSTASAQVNETPDLSVLLLHTVLDAPESLPSFTKGRPSYMFIYTHTCAHIHTSM